MNIKILFMSVFCCAFTPFVTTIAQERPHEEALFAETLKEKDPKVIAQVRTDQMNDLLALSDKQYKKVYKLFLKEEKKRAESFKNPGANGNRPPMDREGMPGEPPGGMGGPRHDFGGERPSPRHSQGTSLKEAENREKKLRKILSEEQYAKWSENQERLKPSRDQETFPPSKQDKTS